LIFNVSNDAGGGVTFGTKKTGQLVYISANPNTSLKDIDGMPLEMIQQMSRYMK
jgi:hypothetical protein